MKNKQFIVGNYYNTVYDSSNYLIAQVQSINTDRTEITVILNHGDSYRIKLTQSASNEYEEFVLTINNEQMLFVSNDYLSIDKKLLNSLTSIEPKLFIKILLSKDISKSYKKKLIQHLVISDEKLRRQFAQKMQYYRQKYDSKYQKLSQKYKKIEQQMIAAQKNKNSDFDWDLKRAESIYYNQKSLKLIKKCNYLWHTLKKLGYLFDIKNDTFIID